MAENVDDESPRGGVDDDHRVVDPTKNVLDLVRAESKYQDGMRASLKEMHNYALSTGVIFQNFAREQETRFQNAMRDVESKRVDQLAIQRQGYEERIADMLSESVRSTSALVSTQLLQIQSTFDARVSKLEEFRLTSQGRSSVSDPALAMTLQTLASSIGDLSAASAASLAKITTTVSGLTTASSEGIGADRRSFDIRDNIFAIIGAIGVIGLILVDWLHK